MPTLAGFAYTSAGVAISGATVNIYSRNSTTPVVTSTTTNANGYWQTAGVAEGRYDVEIVNSTTYIRRKYDDEVQLERAEIKTLQVRGSDNAYAYTLAGAAITAARTLNLPLITGTDTISVLGLAQTYSAVKTFSAKPVIGVASSFTGALDFVGTTSGTVTQTVAAAAGTWTFTLPTSGGTANYAMTTNGSGVASWAQVSLTAGVTGVLPVANGGTNASSASITAFNNITGYSASGATGTTSTNLVFSANPTLTGSPVINATASVGGVWTAAATWTLPAFTLGGTVTLNGQTFLGQATFDNGAAADYTAQLFRRNSVDKGGVYVKDLGSGGRIENFAEALWTVRTGAATHAGSTERFAIDNSFIYTTLPIEVGAASTNNAFWTASQGAGSTTMYIGNASINVTSDARAKADIVPFTGSALALIDRLNVSEYDYRDNHRPFGGVYSGKYVGLTAQNIYEVAPWAVNTQGGKDCWECRSGLPCEDHLPWQVKAELLDGLTIKAIQELKADNTELRRKVAALERA